jgi:hypothetical protein
MSMTAKSIALLILSKAYLAQLQCATAACLDTSIETVKQNPQEFDGKSIAVNAVFNFSLHGRVLTDPEDENAGVLLVMPPTASNLPLVDALEKNIFRTKVGIYHERITGVFCGKYDRQSNSLILDDIEKLTIEMQSRSVKGNGPVYP